MRPQLLLVLLGTLFVAACGSTRDTTVVAAPPGSTVVVPPGNGDTHVVTPAP
jgi:hypothetical protein